MSSKQVRATVLSGSEALPCAFGPAAVLVKGKSEAQLAALCERAERFADQCAA